jgi:hypothetical protein
MARKRLYLFIAMVAFLALFTTGALCNQCSVAEESSSFEEEAVEEETVEEETEIEAEEEAEEGTEGEGEEEAGEEVEEEEELPEEGLVEPTIDLEIYKGPIFSEADGVCYYRIRAIVTGNPSPDVDFSKDDSGGAWEPLEVQINLNNPTDTYNLTAKASNSKGEDTDSITLDWGCNRKPVISEIVLMGSHFTGIEYEVSVSASDPDGDALSYKWNVDGGTIDDDTKESIIWTAPSEPGSYTITAAVSDGKGGEATKHSIVDVTFLYDILAEASDYQWTTSAGNIDFGGSLSDSRGFATYRTNIKLEDGNVYSKVLETHPEWKSGGWIAGLSTSNITIPDGAKFTAKVGFIDGATATDGVKFYVRFYYEGTSYTYAPIDAAYDGVLTDINLNLNLLYGKTARIQILVYAGPSSAQDWAVWVNPKITN